MTTTEGNKLIAAFMEKPDHIMPELLKYHSSWDWLMPVVEKIVDLGFIVEIPIAKSGTDVFIYNKQERLNIVAYLKPIDAVWNAVVQFIQWYNTQPQAKT